MAIHKWQRIQDLFLEAADLPPDEQRRFLDSACLGDADLRQEVGSLLASDRTASEGIATILEEAAQSLLGADPVLGVRLGPWRVVREIGRGGMGAVYLAVRDDEQFQQQAAIKVMKYGLDTDELLGRFRRERQILASLDHPYIARLIDGGSTPEGRPYFVMEYIEGQTIDAWRRAHNPSVEECCRLFLKVCEAVACAHRSLIVHRDLKPGNILIAADGSPKLLDFGVAKLLSPDEEPDRTVTGIALRPLTPEYASPEQVLGRPVTTATDVYSLGAILYELLTGSKAHRLPSRSPSEIEYAVCVEPVSRPSDAVPATQPGAARLRRRLSGDLDNIVQMAMRKEPGRRYPSVDRFAADIGSFLDGWPVSARRDSWRYRGSKFIRRHRLALSAAALCVLSLLLGTVLALSQARRAEVARQVAETQRQLAESQRHAAEREHSLADQERARAESEAQLARGEQRRAQQRLTEMVDLANHSLFDIHSQIERLPGATEARKQIVNTTLQYLEELSKDAANDERLRMAAGAGYLKLAQVQGEPYGPSLRDYPGALQSYRRAADLIGPLRQAHPGDPQALMTSVDIQIGTANVLTVTAGGVQAEALLKRALVDVRSLARLRPNDLEALRREGLLDGSMAWALKDHDLPGALAWSRKFVAAATELAARFPDREIVTEALSDAHTDVASFLSTLGHLDTALADYKEAAAARERLSAARPHDVVRLRNLMLAYGHIGSVLGDPFRPNLGDFSGARTYYAKAVAIAEQAAAADPRNGTARYDVAAALVRLGAVDVPASGLAQSLDELNRAAAIQQAVMLASPDDVAYASDWQLAQEYIGNRLRDLGRLPEAMAAYRRSLDSAIALLDKHPDYRPACSQVVASGRALAQVLAVGGDREGALAQARDILERTRAAIASGTDRNIRAYYLAKSLVALGSAYRILAQKPGSETQRAADWRQARAAAESALTELAAVPKSDQNPLFGGVFKEAREIVAQASGHE